MSNDKRDRNAGFSRLSDLAYSKLRYAISEGQIGAGERLVELELCKTLKMGRSPIHDALLRLTGDGLVESVPNAGFHVRHLTWEDIEMAYEIRAALECLALRLACRRGFSDMRLAELERACDLHREAVRRRDTRAAAHADFHFHRGIIALANSARLETAIRSSHIQFFTWSRSVPAGDYLTVSEPVVDEHQKIVELLKQRKGDEAEKALSHHISGVAHERLKKLARSTNLNQMLRGVSVLGDFAQPASGDSTGAMSQ
ncbi:MAG: GntR family transcriptional regulator [Verrucomicrobia bacterium]|nr:GntR family transcriptional regulator [Verrucomicrobiota bacterium]